MGRHTPADPVPAVSALRDEWPRQARPGAELTVGRLSVRGLGYCRSVVEGFPADSRDVRRACSACYKRGEARRGERVGCSIYVNQTDDF